MKLLLRLLTAAALVRGVALADPLPDLVPQLYFPPNPFQANQTVGAGDVAEGCAGATTGRLLLRFGIRFHNQGGVALAIGNPGCPDCKANPGAICTDDRFICSPADGHNHPHFVNFALYQLLDFKGNLVKLGGKKSFCLRDNYCDNGASPSFVCTNQGLSPGCTDDYDPSLGCQYIDMTDVPGATTRAFRLRATIDPDDILPDADHANNTTELVIPGCGDGVVQDGEQCDPGATPADPCCRDDCTLEPPGSPCNTPPPPGPCGTADAPFADGTTCGPGEPPCIAQICRGGVCQAETGSGGCAIGAACFAPGATDPVDSCQRCDPSQRANGWSVNVDPDLPGLRCQVGRVSGAMAGIVCNDRAMKSIAVRIGKIEHLLDRRQAITQGAVGGVDRSVARQITRLAKAQRRAAKAGCAVDGIAHEVGVLTQQFATFQTSDAPPRGRGKKSR